MTHVVRSVVASATVMGVPLGCTALGKARQAMLPGIVIGQRILECLAVPNGRMEYVSVFGLGCQPSQAQVAILIAGYQAGEPAADLRGDLDMFYRPDRGTAPNVENLGDGFGYLDGGMG